MNASMAKPAQVQDVSARAIVRVRWIRPGAYQMQTLHAATAARTWFPLHVQTMTELCSYVNGLQGAVLSPFFLQLAGEMRCARGRLTMLGGDDENLCEARLIKTYAGEGLLHDHQSNSSHGPS